MIRFVLVRFDVLETLGGVIGAYFGVAGYLWCLYIFGKGSENHAPPFGHVQTCLKQSNIHPVGQSQTSTNTFCAKQCFIQFYRMKDRSKLNQ